MLTKENIALGVSIFTLIAVFGFGLIGGNTNQNNSGSNTPRTFSGVTNYDALTLDDGNLTISKGTTTSMSVGEPAFFNNAGFDFGYFQQAFVATSSVVCSIKNPFGATTTVLGFTAVTTSGSFDGAGEWDLSTSTAVVGSSTPAFVYGYPVAGGDFQFMSWLPNLASSTNNAILAKTFTAAKQIDGSSPFFLAPNEFLTWRQASSTGGVETVTGTCSAEFSRP